MVVKERERAEEVGMGNLIRLEVNEKSEDEGGRGTSRRRLWAHLGLQFDSVQLTEPFWLQSRHSVSFWHLDIIILATQQENN